MDKSTIMISPVDKRTYVLALERLNNDNIFK